MKIADEYVWLAIEAGRAACRRKVLPTTEAELFAFTKGALEQHVGAVCDALAGVDTEPAKEPETWGQQAYDGPDVRVTYDKTGYATAHWPKLPPISPNTFVGVDLAGEGSDETSLVMMTFDENGPRLLGVTNDPAIIHSLIADSTGDTFLPVFPEACPACATQLRSDHKNGERCPGCGQPVILV